MSDFQEAKLTTSEAQRHVDHLTIIKSPRGLQHSRFPFIGKPNLDLIDYLTLALSLRRPPTPARTTTIVQDTEKPTSVMSPERKERDDDCPEDNEDLRKQRNIIYSRRKRQKKRRLIEDLRQATADLNAKNLSVYHKNKKLEALIEQAEAIVKQHQEGKLAPEDIVPARSSVVPTQSPSPQSEDSSQRAQYDASTQLLLHLFQNQVAHPGSTIGPSIMSLVPQTMVSGRSIAPQQPSIINPQGMPPNPTFSTLEGLAASHSTANIPPFMNPSVMSSNTQIQSPLTAPKLVGPMRGLSQAGNHPPSTSPSPTQALVQALQSILQQQQQSQQQEQQQQLSGPTLPGTIQPSLARSPAALSLSSQNVLEQTFQTLTQAAVASSPTINSNANQQLLQLMQLILQNQTNAPR